MWVLFVNNDSGHCWMFMTICRIWNRQKGDSLISWLSVCVKLLQILLMVAVAKELENFSIFYIFSCVINCTLHSQKLYIKLRLTCKSFVRTIWVAKCEKPFIQKCFIWSFESNLKRHISRLIFKCVIVC